MTAKRRTAETSVSKPDIETVTAAVVDSAVATTDAVDNADEAGSADDVTEAAKPAVVVDNTPAAAKPASAPLSSLRSNMAAYATPSGGSLFGGLQAHRDRLIASLPEPGEHELRIDDINVHTGRMDPAPHVLAVATCSIEGNTTPINLWLKLPEAGADYTEFPELARQVLRDLEQLVRIVGYGDVGIDTLDDLHRLVNARFRAIVGRRIDRDGLPTAAVKTVIAPTAK